MNNNFNNMDAVSYTHLDVYKRQVQIGKNGLNDHIKTSVRNALDARELIKVTLLQNTMEDIHEVAEILEEEIGCDTVLKIGRILILYKESAKKENRKLSPKVKAIQK